MITDIRTPRLEEEFEDASRMRLLERVERLEGSVKRLGLAFIIMCVMMAGQALFTGGIIDSRVSPKAEIIRPAADAALIAAHYEARGRCL